MAIIIMCIKQDELSGTIRTKRFKAYHAAAAVSDNRHYLENNVLHESVIFMMVKPCAQARTNTVRRTPSLSMRSNLLLTPGARVLNASSCWTIDPPEGNNNHSPLEEEAR